MRVFNIVAVDDERTLLLTIACSLEKIFDDAGAKAEMEIFSSPKKLLQRMKDKRFDLAFLDIDMPEMDGIDLGKKIKDVENDTEIIYLSGREERVFDAFAVHPFGFVRKSNFLQDVTDVVQSFVKSFEKGDKEDYLDIRSNGRIVSVNVKELVYVECIKDYQYFYFNNKSEPIKMRSTMSKIEEELAPYGFIRVHKGYVVGYRYIRRIDENSLLLSDGKSVIPVSRRNMKEVKEKYLQYGYFSGRTQLT